MVKRRAQPAWACSNKRRNNWSNDARKICLSKVSGPLHRSSVFPECQQPPQPLVKRCLHALSFQSVRALTQHWICLSRVQPLMKYFFSRREGQWEDKLWAPDWASTDGQMGHRCPSGSLPSCPGRLAALLGQPKTDTQPLVVQSVDNHRNP
jgi:hypothetical protein